jgi:hypothetical protein
MTNNASKEYMSRILDGLLKLFSSATGIFKDDLKSDGKDSQMMTFINPILNVLAVTVPEPLFSAFSLSYVEDGLAPRFLFFDCEKGERNFKAKEIKINSHVLQKCKEYAKKMDVYQNEISFDLNIENNNDKFLKIESITQAKIIEYDEPAKELLNSIIIEFDQWRGRGVDRVRSAIYSRAVEQIKKLALVYSDDSKITTFDLIWAYNLYSMTSENYIQKLNLYMTSKGLEGLAQKVKRAFM